MNKETLTKHIEVLRFTKETYGLDMRQEFYLGLMLIVLKYNHKGGE